MARLSVTLPVRLCGGYPPQKRTPTCGSKEPPTEVAVTMIIGMASLMAIAACLHGKERVQLWQSVRCCVPRPYKWLAFRASLLPGIARR